MGLAKLILNTILFIVTFVIILFLGYGLLFFVTWPAGSTTIDRVHIVADEGEIGYVDALKFWTTSISENFQSEPEYVTRSWFGWDWWETVAYYPDLGYHYVKGAFIPIILPMYELRQVTIYNGLDETWDELLLESQGISLGEIIDLQSFEDIATYLELTDDQQAKMAGALINRNNWTSDYTEFYNINLKMERYNTDTYDDLMVKFVEDNGLGLRRISGVAVILFYQIVFTSILTILYVHQHPITLKKGEDNQSEVDGDLVPVKLPGHKKRRQKRKAKKLVRMQKQVDKNK